MPSIDTGNTPNEMLVFRLDLKNYLPKITLSALNHWYLWTYENLKIRNIPLTSGGKYVILEYRIEDIYLQLYRYLKLRGYRRQSYTEKSTTV